MIFGVYLNQYAKFYKMFKTKVVHLIEIHIFCFKNFFPRVIVSEKISDTYIFMKKPIKIMIFFVHLKGDFIRGEGMPSFIVMCSNLEGVKKVGFGRGGRGAFFNWGVFQFERREKSGLR